MQFSPEAGQLKCPHCGHTQAMIAGSSVKAHEFTDTVAGHLLQPMSDKALQVSCSACGSVISFEPPEVAGVCSFCGTAIVAQPKAADPLIAPDGVLPVKLPKPEALSRLQKWLSSRWFAPSALQRLARPEGLNGVYLPFWTYYFHADSDYAGERGEHYYTTETYTETDSSGNSVTRTREVQHTRWISAVPVDLSRTSFVSSAIVSSSRYFPSRSAAARSAFCRRGISNTGQSCLPRRLGASPARARKMSCPSGCQSGPSRELIVAGCFAHASNPDALCRASIAVAARCPASRSYAAPKR